MENVKLKPFHAWGMVTVEKNKITIILATVDTAGELHKRTLVGESERDLPEGTALLAIGVDDSEGGFTMAVNELGETRIADHPIVADTIAKAAGWIKQLA